MSLPAPRRPRAMTGGARLGLSGLAAPAAAFVVLSSVLLELERRMWRAGRRGIVHLEWAGSASNVDRLFDRWGVEGRRAALASVRVEFAYAIALPWFLTAVRRELAPSGAARPSLRLAAAFASLDLLQSVALSLVHAGRRDPWPALARAASLTKFVPLGLEVAAVGRATARAQRIDRGARDAMRSG